MIQVPTGRKKETEMDWNANRESALRTALKLARMRGYGKTFFPINVWNHSWEAQTGRDLDLNVKVYSARNVYRVLAAARIVHRRPLGRRSSSLDWMDDRALFAATCDAYRAWTIAGATAIQQWPEWQDPGKVGFADRCWEEEVSDWLISAAEQLTAQE